MIDEDSLNVWHQQQLIGHLWRDSTDRMGFRYADEWLQAPVFALSLSLPLNSSTYSPEDGIAHRFFSNLLPEGTAREQIVRDFKIADNEFALLKAIGGECAGAISVLPVEQSPGSVGAYYRITEDDLRTLIKRRGHGYNQHDSVEQPRLSLAGAQNKCTVFATEDNYFHPSGDAASTHILKFESTDYRHLPVYEVFTTMLADNAELNVVSLRLEQTGEKNFVKVRRYDRKVLSYEMTDQAISAQVERIHQEDFCQALGFGHAKKYQADGGPTFASCYKLLASVSTEPALDTQALLKWFIFNVLAGNSDGHAKNISLIHQPAENTAPATIRLAPFYDLVCTRAIDRIDSKLAFSVGKQRIPDNVTRHDWHELANACDISPRFLDGLLDNMVTTLSSVLMTTREQFESMYGPHPVLQRVEKIVKQQCKHSQR